MPSFDLWLDNKIQAQRVPAFAPQSKKDSLYAKVETEELVEGATNIVQLKNGAQKEKQEENKQQEQEKEQQQKEAEVKEKQQERDSNEDDDVDR